MSARLLPTSLPPKSALKAKAVRLRRPRRRVVAVRAQKTKDGPRVAVAGVTGAVGQEFLKVQNAKAISTHRALGRF